MLPDQQGNTQPQPAKWLKVVALVKKRPELSREDFVRLWVDEHTRLSVPLGMSPYRINIVTDTPDGREPLYDGSAEMYWPSREALDAALASDQGVLAGIDTERFATEVTLLIVDEHEVITPSRKSERQG